MRLPWSHVLKGLVTDRKPMEGVAGEHRGVRFTVYKDYLLWLQCGNRWKWGKSGDGNIRRGMLGAWSEAVTLGEEGRCHGGRPGSRAMGLIGGLVGSGGGW